MTDFAFAIDAARIALATLLDAAALVIWDIGTRSPSRLVADLRAGLRDRAAVGRGLVRLMTGLLAIGLAIAVSRPVAFRPADFSIVESVALGAALIIESLVGPALRARR